MTQSDHFLQLAGIRKTFGKFEALKSITLDVVRGELMVFLGPSGCGKTTLLRIIAGLETQDSGMIRQAGRDITRLPAIRRDYGIVFQSYALFPNLSIYDNVAYGPRLMGVKKKAQLDEVVERSLRGAALWDEVRSRLKSSALGMSGGQQQRLCIARAIAVEPEVILMDEPCSALDPIATARIEELMQDLKTQYTQVIVTHNMQQASRVSDYTAFLYLGELIEYGATEKLFINPMKKQTEDYITGRFG